MPKTGRPPGRVIHSEAVEAIIRVNGWLKRDVCAEAGISPTFLSDLLAHRGGATDDVVDRLSAALGVNPAAIFPELAGWVSPLPDRKRKREASAA